MTFGTDNLDYALAPLIASAMAQYIESFKEEGLPKYPSSFNDVEEWLSVLEEIHWAFDNYSSPPDTAEYDFDIEWEGPGENENGYQRVEVRVVGDEEHQRYSRDVETHEARVQNGINLFAIYFKSLWL